MGLELEFKCMELFLLSSDGDVCNMSSQHIGISCCGFFYEPVHTCQHVG